MSQPITPPVTTRRPSAAMPLAYPFGASQPLGCNICKPCKPADGVSSFVFGSTAKLGPFGMVTDNSPSHSFRGHAGRCRTTLRHLPQGKSLELAGFRLRQLGD